MESLEVHPRSFVIKWVSIPKGCTLYYSIAPKKKSINFGIFSKNPSTVNVPSEQHYVNLIDDPSSINIHRKSAVSSRHNSSVSSDESLSVLSETLSTSGLFPVQWKGRVPGNETVEGSFCPDSTCNSLEFALVFDNLFSKTTSKSIRFSKSLSAPSSILPPTSSHTDNSAIRHGTLLKHKRRRGQGFAKRQFLLDRRTGVLSYFLNSSSVLRGSIQLHDAAISAKKSTREFFIDSGCEVWHLKALTDDSWQSWFDEFSLIKAIPVVPFTPTLALPELPLNQIASLLRSISSLNKSSIENAQSDISLAIDNGHIKTPESLSPIISSFRRAFSISSGESVYADAMETLSPPPPSQRIAATHVQNYEPEFDIRDQDQVVLLPDHDDDYNESSDVVDTYNDMSGTEESTSSATDLSTTDELMYRAASMSDHAEHPEVTNLYPLPWKSHVKRRTNVPYCDIAPISLFAFLRKNVGKDLTSIAMPVSSNEPIGLLQRYSEAMEYCHLLDEAAAATNEHGEQIFLVAAFAISMGSNNRERVRANRKPYNPLLGETYELVREDMGFRLIAEKISHRPPIMATYSESRNWTFQQAQQPEQKFWGKSVELTTGGTVLLNIRGPGGNTMYKWSMPTSILRNLVAGEKYLEPHGGFTIHGSDGSSVVIQFKSGGMFSGRTERVMATGSDRKRHAYNLTLTGSWLRITKSKLKNESRFEVWHVGDIVEDPVHHFGFTEFAAQLNEITEIEDGHMAPTDSRLRPDQRLWEQGEVDAAQQWKDKVEEKQRERRKLYPEGQNTFMSKWFEKTNMKWVSNEALFTPKRGKDSYWATREKQTWEPCELW
ncbi:hypothetical protein CANCADRAFT_52865 [Tortispora caseinolytica NRRL Y-17796]|uniref:PH domain-containing protein n=1 Tax=Tortispora caseinolytica NRRL Y-17796 TaxID=767744 RepID=A0A1E4TAE0_9ASCO|nr:hypothetical protein CANCADRAFT_52865 [Tortispora caseinolytica NRRL Y-17796]